MNSLIETLNEWGGRFLDFAWPMAWQTALLITALLAFDFLFRRRVRASVRYALWLVVLVKLIVPPTLALPTSPAWWLHTNASLTPITPRIQNYSVTYDPASLPPASNPLPAFIPPAPAMTLTAWLLVLSVVVSAVLLIWLLVRWWQITRQVSVAWSSSRLTAILAKTQLLAGVRSQPPVKLTGNTMSPAVCGLFRPAILIPRALVEQFSDEQLRAVLLHELIHLRRRDVWLNFAQSLLQIVYWWHPLVWLANARIRRVREEAVDDAVMLALVGEAESYAPTLLEVAKLALNRPLASLGLVGILESRSALRQRIERLVDFRAPRRAGLTLASVFGVLAFTAVAVPMGGAPAPETQQSSPAPLVSTVTTTTQPTNRIPILFEAYICQIPGGDFQPLISGLQLNQRAAGEDSWWSVAPENFSKLQSDLQKSYPPLQRERIQTASGMPAEFYVGNGTNGIEIDCDPVVADGRIILTSQGQIYDSAKKVAVTNQYNVNAPIRNHGGMVLRLKDANGASDRNWIVLIGIQIMTNGPAAHFAQRLEGNIKRAKPLAEDEFKAAGLVQDAKLDYEMGKLDESKASLNTALALDPDNAAAKYYLRLIDTTRQRQQDAGPVRSLSGRVKIMGKLDRIQLDQFWTGKRMPLEEVLRQLSREARQADPEKEGVNIITGFVANDQSAPTNSVFVGSLDLKQVTLVELLDAITLKARPPVKYSIMDNDVVFSAADPQKAQLFLRTYNLDPNTFMVNLRKQVPLEANPSPAEISAALRDLFIKSSVDLKLPPGKTVFYNDRLRALYVKATEPDLDAIQRAITTINAGIVTNAAINGDTVTNIINNENFKAALQILEQQKGSEPLAEPEVATISGRQTDLNAINRVTETTHELSPQIHVKARFFEVPKGTLSGPIKDFNVTRPDELTHQPGQYTGILTAENFKTALQSIVQLKGTEELAEPEAVTTIGRQLSIRATKTVSVVTGFKFKETNGVNEIMYDQSKMEIGPALDMLSLINDHGYTVSLQATVSRTEFFGYADIPTDTPQQYVTNSAGQAIPLPTIWPAVLMNRESVNVNLFDGQTLVLTPAPEAVRFGARDKKRDEIVARHIQAGEKIQGETGKQFVVFVTVSLVDSDGKRLYSDDDLSFAKTDIPSQPPQPMLSDLIIP